MKSSLSRHNAKSRSSQRKKPWEPPTIVVERSLMVRTQQVYIRRPLTRSQQAKA